MVEKITAADILEPTASFETLKSWFAACDGLRPVLVEDDVFAGMSDDEIISQDGGGLSCAVPQNIKPENFKRLTAVLSASDYFSEDYRSSLGKDSETQYAFMAKVSQYLQLINQSKFTPEETDLFTEIINLFRALGSLSDDFSIEKKSLTEEEIQAIEKFLLGSAVTEKFAKKGVTDPRKIQNLKSRKAQQVMRILLSTQDPELKTRTTGLVLHSALSSLNLPEQDLMQTIHDRGVEKWLQEAVTYSGNNLSDNVESIIREPLSDIDKISLIVNLIHFSFRYDANENNGEPSLGLAKQATQCVGFSTLGQALEKIPNVQYLALTMKDHMVSLLKLDGQIYWVDITHNRIYDIVSKDLGLTSREVEDYLNGVSRETRSFCLPTALVGHYGNVDGASETDRVCFIGDKQKFISATLHLNLGGLYADTENEEIKDEKKAEEHYLLAIAAGNKAAHNNLGNLYANAENEEIKDEKKAEEHYLLAIATDNKIAHYNLGSLYSKSEDLELRDKEKAREQYKLAIAAGVSEAEEALAQL